MMKRNRKDLFGGDVAWQASDWTSSDDRVRGGKSQSYLAISESREEAAFQGELDIKTLGGAGFASQRTAGDDKTWDVSSYDAIELLLVGSDDKRYTFNIKDTLLPLDPETGREQSTISYEYDFKPSESADTGACGATRLVIPFSQFKATYRGREKQDAPKLNRSKIRRFGIMCRSFFGEQEGEFELKIASISAIHLEAKDLEAGTGVAQGTSRYSWIKFLRFVSLVALVGVTYVIWKA